jgi:ribonuclease HI
MNTANSNSTFRIISFNANHTPTNVKTLLERHTDYDAVFIQEPHYSVIRRTPSATNPLGDELFGTQRSPDWILLEVEDLREARVACYIRARWECAHPKTRYDIVSHPHLLCFSLVFGGQERLFLNVYGHPRSRVGIHRLLTLPPRHFTLVAGDFNLHHTVWDSTHGDHALGQQILDRMPDLGVSLLNEVDVATHFPHNTALAPSVVDLAWVASDLAASPLTNMNVDSDARVGSDHAPLFISIPDQPQYYAAPRIKPDSKDEAKFFKGACHALRAFATDDLSSAEAIQRSCDGVFQSIQADFDALAKTPRISRRSRPWWNEDCALKLTEFRALRTPMTRKAFRAAVRRAQRAHFDKIIAEKVQSRRAWDLTSWTKTRPLKTTSHINNREGEPMTSFNDFAQGCAAQFFSAQGRPVDMSLVDEAPAQAIRPFADISAQEVRDAIAGSASSSTPGPDQVSWKCLKYCIKDDKAASGLARLYTACVRQHFWPTQLKDSITVVIPKPGKPTYSVLKAYRPIVLLSCIGKAGEKCLADRTQFECVKYSLLHPSQCGGVRAHSTEDAGVLLTHHILAARKEGFHTSCLAFDIAQFFPSVNHAFLMRTLERLGFHPDLCAFFGDYLQGRRTRFRLNGELSDPFDASIGVGQGSALSPILASLAIVPVLHGITKLLDPPSSAGWNSSLVYVDDGHLAVSSPTLQGNVTTLARIYPQVVDLFLRAGILTEHDKLELMHFPRPTSAYHKTKTNPNPTPTPSLTMIIDGAQVTLAPKAIWRYLGFFFDPFLTFTHHVKFYATRALSTVRSYPLLGNSARGIPPRAKRELYISCIRTLMTYGHRVWFHPHRPHKMLTKPLVRAQAAAARWILGAFRTSPTGGMEILAGLLPIPLYLRQLHKRSLLRVGTLPPSHIVVQAASAADLPRTVPNDTLRTYAAFLRDAPASVSLPLEEIPAAQLDDDEPFAPTHYECAPGERVRDLFAARIHTRVNHPRKGSDDFPGWLEEFRAKLRNIQEEPDTVYAFTDGSVLPGAATRAAAAYRTFRGHAQMRARAISCGKATPYDAEMFALAAAIGALTDPATGNASHLHFFTDCTSAITSIIDTSVHPGQSLAILACQRLRAWLTEHPEGTVTFHWCPGHADIDLNELVDRDAKRAAASMPAAPHTSFAFRRQGFRHEALAAWRKLANDTAYRGRHHLFGRRPPVPSDRLPRSSLLAQTGHSSSLTARMTRSILNHAPTGEFRRRFFPREATTCALCGVFHSRRHILNSCARYRRRQNFYEFLKNSSEPGLALRDFLQKSPTAFSFDDAP